MEIVALYNNYPDKFVSKEQLKEEWFSAISIKTIERRLKEAKTIRKFRDISIGTGGKVMINVRGFYLFLLYKEKNKYK
ncbi:hypothetical protein HMPREF9182_0559 [Streptococcus sp. oral taxon 056 str. F0418]|uniref:hypothetical protein n=1 Tax=Streptococcus sp. oral taxon 056 TaxID=712620 RepID=UPI00021805B0|nr:hypothetical protein [Streptococcus sp. oral taxon 056]EGP67271.1 hypothetical protein HMPREF9182_0559 [Streptococcus sp. oral taxon 056 str. F0418]